MWRNLPFLLSGIKFTVFVTVASMAGGLIIGLVAALARISPGRPLQWVSAFYTDFARSTPLLVQLVWAFFALPILIGYSIRPMAAGIGVLSFYVGAYLAEIFRAGILSISIGQRHAGLALGMTGTQVMAVIILPQAVTRMLPPMASTLISLVKDSSLVSVISVTELMWNASSLAAITVRPLEVLTVTAMLYFLLAYPLSLLAEYLHRRYLAV